MCDAAEEHPGSYPRAARSARPSDVPAHHALEQVLALVLHEVAIHRVLVSETSAHQEADASRRAWAGRESLTSLDWSPSRFDLCLALPFLVLNDFLMTDLSRFAITSKWPAQDPDRIQLYSTTSPNGVKVSIMLEETGLS